MLLTPLVTPLVTPVAPAMDGQGNWFTNIFNWGGSDQPQPPHAYQPPPGTGHAPRLGGLPPPNIPQMPQLPAQGSGTSTAWGGPQIPNAAAGPAIDPNQGSGVYGSMPAPEHKYSFMDNPGASDALVAFGAAMLKAPDFNSGLGDAALAVNQVARSYRMPTEQDYARAKMLGMTARLARGGSMTDPSQPGGGVDVDQKTSFYGPGNKLYFAATGPNGEPGVWDNDAGKFIAGGVPGLQRATDAQVGFQNRSGVKIDTDAEKQFYEVASAADNNLIMLQQIKGAAAGAGVGLDFATRISGQLSQLLGVPIGNIDPTDQSTLAVAAKQLQLNWSQKMAGQGQVTGPERQMIADMLPQALTDPDAFNNLVDTLTQVEQRTKRLSLEWFSPNRDDLRQQYGSFMAFRLQRLNEMPINISMTGSASQAAPSSSPPAGGTSGSTQSGVNWSIDN